MEYEYAKYGPEFRNSILKLQRYLWSVNVAVNDVYLKWKYENNPYVDAPSIYVVLYEGKVIGMRGMYGAKWQFGDPAKTEVVLCGSDLVVEPKHRNRGLFRRIDTLAMEDLAQSGHSYVFNFSAFPVTFLRSVRAGWRTAGPHNMYAWDGQQHPERQAGRQRRIPNISISRNARPAKMATLAKKNGPHGKIGHVKDEGYYGWRFGNPVCRYGYLYWEEDGELTGYFVLQTPRQRRTREINIVDWETAGPDIFEALINDVLDRWPLALVSIWTATLEPEILSLLENLGFAFLDKSEGVKHYEPGLLVKSVASDSPPETWVIAGQQLLDLGNWDLRMLYSDYY